MAGVKVLRVRGDGGGGIAMVSAKRVRAEVSSAR